MNQNNHPTIKHKLGLLELADQLKKCISCLQSHGRFQRHVLQSSKRL